ncbi:AIR synthase-related protein [Patescibacteria group bacterium]|nr:AIR synthase-related protein [Patescibacteria group bacterium]
MKKIKYSESGVNYDILDPVKKLAQNFSKKTAINLKSNGYEEISDSRGESAFVWKQGDVLMASVIEGLGTKNLVADAMEQLTKKSYYETIGHDTIAAIINDLITVGATPLVIHAYWAVGDNNWYKNSKRIKELVSGWKKGCDLSEATWGGGETPALKNIIEQKAIDLGGSAVGIIKKKKNLISDKKIKQNDRIILIKSNGINVNGISLTRTIAEKLPQGFATRMRDKKMFGDGILTKSNIYVKLIKNLQKENIDIHYLANITGHGLRKIMRGKPSFTYVLDKIFKPQEVFNFIQEQANLSDYDMYETYNMGQDFAIFVSEKDVEKTLRIIAKNKFKAINAGFIKKGKKQVIIKQKNITYDGKSLDLR